MGNVNVEITVSATWEPGHHDFTQPALILALFYALEKVGAVTFCK